jgi:methionine sulfoxide reductase heme-binding subunit
MLENVSGINSSTALWYASRATGVVALLLMTAVVLLGLTVTRQGRLPGLPRFAVTGLHRNLSLVAVVFVGLHVLTAVADSYVNIPLTAVVVPLASPYERLWIGLGAVSVDITIAVIVTSLLRRHLSRRLWRAVHLLAYLSWPVAWLHSISASRDMLHSWMFLLAVGCALAIVGAVGWRLAAAARDVPRAQRVGLLMSAVHDRAALRDRLTGRDTPAARDRRPPTDTLAGQTRINRR